MLNLVHKIIRYLCIGCLIFICGSQHALGQPVSIHQPNIRTLRNCVNNNPLAPAIIQLHGNDQLEISFDELSHDYHRFRYQLTHCNTDWVPSALPESVFLDGFNDLLIEDYTPSINTTVPYTHYKIKLPNDQLKLKLSGNYLVTVYDEETEQPILTTAFRVVEPYITIDASVSTNTDIDHNQGHHQLSITLSHNNYPIRNPQQELKIEVVQNNRTDNSSRLLKPSFIGNGEIRYEHQPGLIFSAGNEYRRFETISTRYNTFHVQSLSYHRPYYHIELQPDTYRTISYIFDYDHNGHSFIRNAETDHADTEADYFFVHFTLLSPQALHEGEVYLQGDFTHNSFNKDNQLHYNSDKQQYECTLLLKQGAYNYQYLFLPHGHSKAQTQTIEGNHYQTTNEYLILVYQQTAGERYDRLIGSKLLKSP